MKLSKRDRQFVKKVGLVLVDETTMPQMADIVWNNEFLMTASKTKADRARAEYLRQNSRKGAK